MPLSFFLFLTIGIINSLTTEYKIISYFFNYGILIYLSFILFGTVHSLIKEKKYYFLLIGPLIFILLHLSYGFGSFLGLFILKRGKVKTSYDEFLELSFPLKNPFKRKELALLYLVGFLIVFLMGPGKYSINKK